MGSRKHWGIAILTVLAIGPNLMLSVVTMFLQNLFQDSLLGGTYESMWIVILGNLALLLFVPIGPIAIQRFGLRRVYIISMLTFTLGSVTASIAFDMVSLIIGRFLQAMSSGTLLMVMIPALMMSFPAERRNRVLVVLVGGLFGSVAIGPFLGSVAILFDSWRWLFVSVGFLSLVGSILGTILPETVGPPTIKGTTSAPKADWVGLLLIAITSISTAIALGNLGPRGIQSYSVIIPGLLGVVFLLSLIWYESIVPEPILPVHLIFKSKPALGAIMAIMSNISMVVSIAMISIILRSVDQIADQAIVDFYLLLLVGVSVAAILMTTLHDRIGPGVLGIIGALCMLEVSYTWLYLEPGTTLQSLHYQLIFLGTGAGLTTASGLVGAALGGQMKDLPKTMMAVQITRLFVFMFIAPVFTWLVSHQTVAYFQQLSWGLTAWNTNFIDTSHSLMKHFESLGSSPIAANTNALHLIVQQLQARSLILTAHHIYATSLLISGILLLSSIAMAVTGKGLPLAQNHKKIGLRVSGHTAETESN